MDTVFRINAKVRQKAIPGKPGYAIREDGIVLGRCGLALQPMNGRYVNLGGDVVSVAYLVARAFVPNKECRRWVRHRNGDVFDNRAVNLEWSDEKEDRRYKRNSSGSE